MDNLFKIESITEKVNAGLWPAAFVITSRTEGEFRFSDGSKLVVRGPAWGQYAERRDLVQLAKAVVKCGWAKRPEKAVEVLEGVPDYKGNGEFELFPAPPDWDF